MSETAVSQPEKSSETPVADFLKRNPGCTQTDLFLFVLSQLPLRAGIQGDLNTSPNTAMIEAVGRLIVSG